MKQTNKKTIRINKDIDNQLKMLKNKKQLSETQIIELALKYYFDYIYLNENQNIINDEILKIIDSKLNVLESRINNKTNQLLSELAINNNIMNQVLSSNLDINSDELNEYRIKAVEYIKTNQKILELRELI